MPTLNQKIEIRLLSAQVAIYSSISDTEIQGYFA